MKSRSILRQCSRLQVMSIIASGLFMIVLVSGVFFLYLYDFSFSSTTMKPVFVKVKTRSATEALLFIGGDTMLDDAALPLIQSQGYNKPLENVASLLAADDFSIVNAEAPFTQIADKLWLPKKYVYRQSVKALEALKECGIDGLFLANNHILDYGRRGLEETVAFLAEYNVHGLGAGLSGESAGQVLIIEFQSPSDDNLFTRVGLLNYYEVKQRYIVPYDYYAGRWSAGVNALTKKNVRRDMKVLKPLVDVIIVCPHWGSNYLPVTKKQKDWARFLIEAGADAIIGHHAHSHQIIDTIQGKPVFYSVGNFVFGTPGRQTFTAEDGSMRPFRFGLPVRLHIDFEKKHLQSVEGIPILVQNRIVQFSPRRATDRESRQFITQLIQDSTVSQSWLSIIEAEDGPRLRWEQPQQ